MRDTLNGLEVLGVLAMVFGGAALIWGLTGLAIKALEWRRERNDREAARRELDLRVKEVLDTMAATLKALANRSEEDLQTQKMMVRAMERVDQTLKEDHRETMERVSSVRGMVAPVSAWVRHQQDAAVQNDAAMGERVEDMGT